MCIVVSILFESITFFSTVSVFEFIFSSEWEPSGVEPKFGAFPLFYGTFAIAAIALLVAIPFGTLSAIYLSEYLRPSWRHWLKPMLEFVAGIPTVVYGFFAASVLGPWLRGVAERFGIEAKTESALACGLAMGIMIIPYISSLADDILRAIPQAQRENSYALGANHSETIVRVILPAAMPGIIAASILGFSRAIGETMIVVMASGLSANVSANPFDSLTTVTVQIVALLSGDISYESITTKAAYALGLALFISTFIFNILALHVITYYRKKYA